ncbi:MAG TPA: hypothetical protein VL096_17885 [Pirellulaceae bacterium]|nr:hypothetical protein [Pirellulaceae bacterium]
MSVVPTSEAIHAQIEQTKQRRRFAWRFFWIALGCLGLLLFLIPAVVYLVWQAHGRSLLRAELDQIRAAGEPITTAEISAWYTTLPPNTRDITAIWSTALAPFEGPKYDAAKTNVPIIGNVDGPKTLDEPFADEQAVQTFLKLYRPQIEALYTAAKEEGEVRFPRQFEQGVGMLLNEAMIARQASLVLNLEFHMLVQQNDIDAAITNLQTRYKQGETLQHEPVLVGFLVQIAIHGTTIQSIRELADCRELSDEQLQQLQRLVRRMDAHKSFPNCLIGERAWCYHWFHQPLPIFQGNADIFDLPSSPSLSTTDDLSRISRPEDCAMALQFYAQTIAAAKQPFPTALDDAAATQQGIAQLASDDDQLSRMRYRHTLALIPMVESMFVASARFAANIELTNVLLASQRYTLKHGKRPNSLADLVPDFLPQVPIDPFDGQPLRLLPTEQGITFYSVGPDRLDNGGTMDPTTIGPDFAVEVKLPR